MSLFVPAGTAALAQTSALSFFESRSWATCLLMSGLALSSAASAVTLTVESQLDKRQAGYYRLKVGSVDVTALSDGTLGFEAIEQLTNVKPGEAEKLLDRAYVKSPVEASMNAFLIHLGERLILVDAGTGGLSVRSFSSSPRA